MAVDIFLKLGTVTGESLDQTHKDEIDVLSWSWSMDQSGTMHLGTGGGGGKVDVHDLSITKYTDHATPAIMTACVTGKHFPTGKLTVRKAGGNKPLEYYTIDLDKVLVTNYATGGSDGEDRFTETVTLNFEKFHVTYQQQDPTTGSALGGVVECKWNIPASATA
ncbi:type VI secretion system tube protein Hcp [Paraburkholderia guartelaensis]|jgi:type VI secretion system secreted protein Hcp|uniref:Type VI secretion system tube protein Hcp n=1 Tax=Paraburkholderia guartelaensis TaxID=2546446 RepID=A0A4R5L3U6_9BURK|nr:type VI secretion system tube protein Hcp [Paraburkholderia guartelaensis]TDG03281.1 type VI secretion system tube protein Hcp [Paraburkholderia guartelaensis]